MRSALAAPHLPRHGPPPACRALITAGSTQSAHLDREISAPGRSRSDNEPDNDRANTPTTTPIGGLFYLSSPRPRRHRQRLRGAGLPRRRPHRTAGVRHVRRGVRGLGAGLDADGGARARRARRDGRNPGGGTEGGRGGESMMLPIAEPGSRPSFTPIDTIPTYSGSTIFHASTSTTAPGCCGASTWNPINPPSGCRFHPRCPHAAPICAEKTPLLEPVDGDQHTVACHHYREPEARRHRVSGAGCGKGRDDRPGGELLPASPLPALMRARAEAKIVRCNLGGPIPWAQRSLVASLIHATGIAVQWRPRPGNRWSSRNVRVGCRNRSQRRSAPGTAGLITPSPNSSAPVEISCTATGCSRRGSWCVSTTNPKPAHLVARRLFWGCRGDFPTKRR